MPGTTARRALLPCLIAATLAGCANMPQPVSLHEGLHRDSYGPRAIQRSAAGEMPNPLCVPLPYEFAGDISRAILGPLLRAAPVDRTILSEKLEDQFKIRGDIGQSPVAILDRDPTGIVFWHIADLVPLKEV